MIEINWQPYTRIQLLQYLVSDRGYKTYLEIGCDKNQVFDHISVPCKEGVDPRRGGTQRMTSDEFFAKDNRHWDLIFIDGLHTYSQVKTDFVNALYRLNPHGTIVIHDMLPTCESQAGPAPIEKYWLGDVWRLGFDLMCRADVEFKLLTMDFGCGVVTHGHQTAVQISTDTSAWQFYQDHYKELPLTTFEEFTNHAFHKP